MNTNPPIIINGKQLKPAPFVSTSYEYKYAANYVIGGFLLATLDGTLVGEDIVEQMNDIGKLQTSTNCVELIIGCEGGADFLQGAGRIRSVTLSPSDQPFIASYSIIITLETVGGKPAVEPDPDFLEKYCLEREQVIFLSGYTESLTYDAGVNSMALVDNELGVSKSFIKINGQITVTFFGREVCGVPDFDALQQAINIIQTRVRVIMSFDQCNNDDNPFSQYNFWNKWLDSKSLVINDTGTVEWKFDMYMSQGTCAPYAWVDLNSDDKEQYQTGATPQKTKTFNGTIRGLCPQTSVDVADVLDDHIGDPDRLSNAQRGLGVLLPTIINGTWPSPIMAPTDCNSGSEEEEQPNPCLTSNKEEFCYQRISSNIVTKVVAGEITFNAEFGDISACQANGSTSEIVDVTVEETIPSIRYVEHIVPNAGRAIIQIMGDRPAEASVVVRGSIQGCDPVKQNQLLDCIDKQLIKSSSKFAGWILREDKTTISTYSYTRSRRYIRCR